VSSCFLVSAPTPVHACRAEHIQFQHLLHPLVLYNLQLYNQPPYHPLYDDLIILLNGRCLSYQMVSVISVLTDLMLNSQLANMGQDVLHLGISVGSADTSDVVEPFDLVQQIVDNSNDDSNKDGVTPNNNTGDNAGASVSAQEKDVGGGWVTWSVTIGGQQTEDTEESRNNIDTENCGNQLPRRPGVGTTGDEDKPVFSERDLEEEDTLNVSEVLNDTTVWKEQSATNDPGSHGKKYTENDGDNPDL
jgi:hypothetical protein